MRQSMHAHAHASARRTGVRMSERAPHRNNADALFRAAVTELGARGEIAGVSYVRHACDTHGDGILYTLPRTDRLTRNDSYVGRERTRPQWPTRTRTFTLRTWSGNTHANA